MSATIRQPVRPVTPPDDFPEHLASVVWLPLPPERRAVCCWDCRAVFGDPHDAVDHAIRLGHQVHLDYSSDGEANP